MSCSCASAGRLAWHLSVRRDRLALLLVCASTAIVLIASTASAGAQQPEPSVAQPAPQASAQPAAQTAIQTPAPKPPLPNRFNEVTPKWLTLRGEFRDRMEGGSNIGFASGRDDLYCLNRFRFDVAVKPSPLFAVLVQAQDARVQRKDIGPTTAPFRDTFDLRQAYADIGNTQKGPFTLRVGRQELFFGEQRLVGHLTWVNSARSFDGVRATFRTKGFKLDAFGTSVVRILDGQFDKSGNGNRFAGAYGSATTWIPKATVEPYVFWRGDQAQKAERGDIGSLSAATIGTRWVGKLPASFDYGAEMAYQTGSLGSDTVGAWAGHWIVGKMLDSARKLRVAEEYNFASGDSNPTDGNRQTFDQLYPTGHDKMGLADQVGWKNIRDLRSIVEVTPHKGWPVTASLHSWWLADTHDAL